MAYINHSYAYIVNDDLIVVIHGGTVRSHFDIFLMPGGADVTTTSDEAYFAIPDAVEGKFDEPEEALAAVMRHEGVIKILGKRDLRDSRRIV